MAANAYFKKIYFDNILPAIGFNIDCSPTSSRPASISRTCMPTVPPTPLLEGLTRG